MSGYVCMGDYRPYLRITLLDPHPPVLTRASSPHCPDKHSKQGVCSPVRSRENGRRAKVALLAWSESRALNYPCAGDIFPVPPVASGLLVSENNSFGVNLMMAPTQLHPIYALIDALLLFV